MNTDAFHTSLALIDTLAPLVPRITPHDAALARALRTAATAVPLHIAAGQPEQLARAHTLAVRVHTLLLVAQAWEYLPTALLAEATHTARHLQSLTAAA